MVFLETDLEFSNIYYKGKNPVGDINYDIVADDYLLMFTVDDEDIYRIICGDYVLYSNNQILITKKVLNDRNLSGYEAFYYVIAQEIIEQNLKSPSTADFCSMNECTFKSIIKLSVNL